MIIDSHCHVFFSDGKKINEIIDKVYYDMNLVGIDGACLIPSKAKNYSYANQEDTSYLAEIVNEIGEKHPETFFTLLPVNPILPAEFLINIAQKYILNGSITGIKLLTEMNARDKRLEPLAEFLQGHDIPVLFHCWDKTVGKTTYESYPSDLVFFAKKFPSLRILVAHMTGCRFRGIQEFKAYSNILVDTSGSQPEDGYLQYALDTLGADRIIFGSDYSTTNNSRDNATQLGRIDSIDMISDERDKILYKNALKFFKKGV